MCLAPAVCRIPSRGSLPALTDSFPFVPDFTPDGLSPSSVPVLKSGGVSRQEVPPVAENIPRINAAVYFFFVVGQQDAVGLEAGGDFAGFPLAAPRKIVEAVRGLRGVSTGGLRALVYRCASPV
jgi:hypothetical protein